MKSPPQRERQLSAAQPATAGIPDPVVEFEHVNVGYGATPVLIDMNFSVERGDFVSLLGPSGCGKSTCLNVTAGLLKVHSGAARFNGEPIVRTNTSTGYMTQDDTLLPWKNVRDNIALPLRIKRRPATEIRERTNFYLELLDVAHAADKYPSQLSGGMKRRVLLARSMIYDPEILLMDEPFAALDAQMRADLHVELRRMCNELNQTVLFVTHDIGEAAVLSDRVIVVGGGPPSSVCANFDVGFGRHRDLEAIRYSQELRELEAELHAAVAGSGFHQSNRDDR